VTTSHPAGHGLRVDGGNRISIAIHKCQLPCIDMGRPELRQHAHALDDIDRAASHIHGVAATAYGVRPLDHRDVEAVAIEPVGQRRPGDAGAGDQDRAGFCALRLEHIAYPIR